MEQSNGEPVKTFVDVAEQTGPPVDNFERLAEKPRHNSFTFVGYSRSEACLTESEIAEILTSIGIKSSPNDVTFSNLPIPLTFTNYPQDRPVRAITFEVDDERTAAILGKFADGGLDLKEFSKGNDKNAEVEGLFLIKQLSILDRVKLYVTNFSKQYLAEVYPRKDGYAIVNSPLIHDLSPLTVIKNEEIIERIVVEDLVVKYPDVLKKITQKMSHWARMRLEKYLKTQL
ncbi:unnamed protein product [Caenorhabditis sp. 36 PRJEB53466]|nr:unnamed protein product [Caenorhabditis sp. 36 PRJEB53466]